LRAAVGVGLIEVVSDGFAVRHASGEQARDRRDRSQWKSGAAIWKQIGHSLKTTAVAGCFTRAKER
jgi:hypothetical protein